MTWPQWNVSLWINNDPGLYNMAREHIRRCQNRDQAARMMADALAGADATHTPDGARYTKTSILAAMRGMGARE